LVLGFRAGRNHDARWSGSIKAARPSRREQRQARRHRNPAATLARREVARQGDRCHHQLLETAQRAQEDSEPTAPEREWKTPASRRARFGWHAVTNARSFRITPTRRPHPPPGGGRFAAL